MISIALKKCIDNGIKIYPVCDNWKWYVEVNDNGKIKRYEKPIQSKEINTSIEKTIIHYASKINQL